MILAVTPGSLSVSGRVRRTRIPDHADCRRRALGGDDALDRRQGSPSGPPFAVGADVELQHRVVGDDVGLGARVQAVADREHGGLARLTSRATIVCRRSTIDAASTTEVDGGLRPGGIAAPPVHRHPDAVRRGERRPPELPAVYPATVQHVGRGTTSTGGSSCARQIVDHAWHRPPSPRPAGRARQAFRFQWFWPLARRSAAPNQARRVHVMPAGMGHRDLASPAGEGPSPCWRRAVGVLLHRQGVHVGPAAAPSVRCRCAVCPPARAAYPRGDLVQPDWRNRSATIPGRAVFGMGQFGVLVQVAVQRFLPGTASAAVARTAGTAVDGQRELPLFSR